MSVPAGTAVEVIHGALKRSNGHLAGVTEESLTVETGNGLSVIARTEVVRMSVLSRSRGKHALIGMAIGAAAGAVIAAAAVKSNDIDIRHDLIIGVPAALGGGIGAGIGAATGGPETVYRVRRK
jgi:hypothetical protein